MSQSGGRRIMRSLMIDQRSVRFLDEGDIEKMAQFAVLLPYLDAKRQEIDRWNAEQGADGTVNGRRLTNIGTFRAYVLAYLQSRRDIAQDKTLLVRQLAPSENGLPLEIYAFAGSTVWSEYEGIQADIFDHLIAILPDFDLRLFQRPAGADLAALAAA
jgi:miniconductance mechanosensitive channel